MLKIWRRYTRFQSSVRRGRDTDEPPAMKWKDLPQLDQWDEWCTGKKPEETRSGQKWPEVVAIGACAPDHISHSIVFSLLSLLSMLSFTLFYSVHFSLLCSLPSLSLYFSATLVPPQSSNNCRSERSKPPASDQWRLFAVCCIGWRCLCSSARYGTRCSSDHASSLFRP